MEHLTSVKAVMEAISFTANNALGKDMMKLNYQLEEIKCVLLTHERSNGMGGVGKSWKLLDEYEFQNGEEEHKMKLCIVKDGTSSPLHLAARCSNFEVVEVLLEKHPQLFQHESSEVFPQFYMSKQLDDPKVFFAMTIGSNSQDCKSFRRMGFCSACMEEMTELSSGLPITYMASRIPGKLTEPGSLWDIASTPFLWDLFQEEFATVHHKNHSGFKEQLSYSLEKI